MGVELRQYQLNGTEMIRASLRLHRRVLFVLPTGGGKTVVFSWIAQKAQVKGSKVVIVAHRKEIVRQISRALDRIEVPHALILPGTSPSESQIQVAMVQTLARRIARTAFKPDLLIIDEAHHAVAGTWEKVAAAWPQAKVLGVTATPLRLDGRGLAEAFDDLVEGSSVRELIEQGYLARYRYLAPPPRPELAEALSRVHTRYGEYVQAELAQAVDQKVITGDIVEHYNKHLMGAPSLVFCCNVAHAVHLREAFAARGFRAASVDGAMPSARRDDILRDFGCGRLNVLTSCDLISEGFDVPDTQGVSLARPTKSLALHLQQVGRALRPKTNGQPALILDHAGNVAKHDLPDAYRQWTLSGRKKDTAAPISTCDRCFMVMSREDRELYREREQCPRGHEWEEECGLYVPPRHAPGEGDRDEPEQIDGELEEIDTGTAWMKGIDPVTCSGVDLYRLRCLARTPEQLAVIARAKGYKRGWVHTQMQLRAAHKAELRAAQQQPPEERP